MDRLEPCPHCKRHVRISESSCPFCGRDVSQLSALPERALPSTRLGRAALFAFGAGAAALAGNTVACTDEPDPDIDQNMDESASGNPSAGNDAGATAGGGGGAGDAGASKDAGGGITQLDAGTVVALYGLAVPGGNLGGGQPGGAFVPDASKPTDPQDAGRAKDAGPGGDLGGAVALYGLAPAPDSGKPASDAGRDAGFIRRDAGGIVPLYGLAIPDPNA
jgi:hypothetical protein